MDNRKVKLEDMVKHAYSSVPLYMEYANQLQIIPEEFKIEDWNSLPLVNKNTYADNNGKVVSVKYLQALYQDKLIVSKTSGSTGKCLELYWDESDFTNSLLSLWIYRRNNHDIYPKDKMCSFYTINTIGNQEKMEIEASNSLTFSKNGLDENRLYEIYNKMLDYKPKWMILQPSIAVLLIEVKQKFNLPEIESLKYIELTSEMLFEDTKKRIQENFKCTVVNQYGSNEVNSIAYECKCGNLHMVSSNVFVEVIEDDMVVPNGTEGEIYITSLKNKAMPIVRYAIGDRGKIYHSHKCNCGNTNPIIELTSGRSNDLILLEDGKKITSYVFVRAIEAINFILDNAIIQFQIEQKDYNHFVVKFVIDDEINEGELEEIFIENLIEPLLRDASYEFEYYESMFPDDKNGKLLYFKSYVN